MPVARQIEHGLSELEAPLLRVRDLVRALLSMMTGAPDLTRQASDAIDALAWTILDELDEITEECSRLTHLAAKVAQGGSDAEGN